MNTYRFANRKTGRVVTASFTARWECNYSSISDNYTPKERDAHELLEEWAELASKHYPNQLVPIYWAVRIQGEGISTFETIPFQYEGTKKRHSNDFLDFFTHPYDPNTKKQMNWFHLDVANVYWNKEHASKGGFIQEATGWKPSILQPFVSLPTLIFSAAQQLRPIEEV